MRKQCLRILIALIGAAGLGMAAKAQVLDQIVVNIPYQFVVADKTLPAGTYRANRLSNDKWEGLVLSSVENRAGVIVHPIAVESAPADKAQVSFETVGDQHFLSKIETASNLFIIRISRSQILEAAGGSASGSSAGSN